MNAPYLRDASTLSLGLLILRLGFGLALIGFGAYSRESPASPRSDAGAGVAPRLAPLSSRRSERSERVRVPSGQSNVRAQELAT